MDSHHGAPQQDQLIGQTVGNYLVKQKLGEGGMGSVYLAEHPTIGKKVALKVLHAEFSGNEEVAQRFFHEAKAVNNIGHPNIVDIVDYGVIHQGGGRDQLVYFIMEYLSGQSLSALLRSEQQPLPPERALGIALQVADALSASHKCNIVHRDLKPDNIMLQQRGRERDFVKLLDFGIAKLTGDGTQPSRTRTGIVMGTPAYMSPEQCEGKANVDLRTDIYALGIVLYEMIVGRVPFIGEGYGEILVQHLTQNPVPPSSFRIMSPHIEAVILKALQKRMELRYPSMDEFMRAMSDPVGYVEANGGLAQFYQRQLMPSSVPFTLADRPSQMPGTSQVYGTPPPGSLTPPSGIYQPGQIGTPTPTTLGAAAGQVTGGGRSKLGFIIAGVLIVAGAGAAIAVVAGKKSNNTVTPAGSGSDDIAAIPDAGTDNHDKTVARDAAIVVTTPDAAIVAATVDAAIVATPDAAVIAEPTQSTITIVTKPAGAAIFVDGKDTGKKTPEPFTVDRGKKTVTIDLRLSNFDTMTLKKFAVDADANVDYSLKPKKSGTTGVKTPPNGTGKGSNTGSGGKTGNDTGLERPE